jgi:hypothetical protein
MTPEMSFHFQIVRDIKNDTKMNRRQGKSHGKAKPTPGLSHLTIGDKAGHRVNSLVDGAAGQSSVPPLTREDRVSGFYVLQGKSEMPL